MTEPARNHEANHVDSTTSEFRSGVQSKTRRDGGGWGLILVGLDGAPKAVPLSDGAVVGANARDARVAGPGVAPEHVRVSVRSDGCYLEDLGAPEGTFVGGVRMRKLNVGQGAVIRMGRQLAVFVERDLADYTAETIQRTGKLVHGPKQGAGWIAKASGFAKSGVSVCLEGGPGIGKRTLARLLGASREAMGDVVVVEPGAEKVEATTRPTTFVALNADKLPRQVQLDITHAVTRTPGSCVIATLDRPLDRAAGDGDIAPWFAALFSGRRVPVPSLEDRREDILLIVGDIADQRKIPRDAFSADFLEAILRAGWPEGVPQLEAVIGAAAAAAKSGPLQLSSIAARLARPTQAKPTLPPGTDPGLARARLEDALARANGSVASAARRLGMSRQAIYREAERLGLDIARRRPR